MIGSQILFRIMFIFFIIAIVMNLFGFYRFLNVNHLETYERRFVTYDIFDTGDILLVSFENMGKIFVGSMFNIEFLHPTLVVKENDETYVLELMAYRNKKGFQKMKLEEWFNRNKSNHILHNKLETSDEKREELSRRLISFTNMYSDGSEKISKVGGFNYSWWNRYVNPKGVYKNFKIKNGETPCNEFCTKVLVDSGVVRGDRPIGHYHPDQFVGMKGFTLNDGYEYKDYYLCDLSRFRY